MTNFQKMEAADLLLQTNMNCYQLVGMSIEATVCVYIGSVNLFLMNFYYHYGNLRPVT